MFRQPASSSYTPRDPPSDLSPDQSSCSSDTGDVLIRSTRILLPDCRREAGPGPEPVQITIQKLRDPAPVHPLPQRRPKPRQKPDTGAPPRAVADGQPGKSPGRCHGNTGDLSYPDPTGGNRRTLKEPGRTKENREPAGSLPPTAESNPDGKLSAGTQSDRQSGERTSSIGHDLLTSRFTAGGRGVVLAALKQCSHSAPRRREIKVKLLGPGPLQTSSRDAPVLRPGSQDAAGVAGVQMEAGLSSGRLGDATNAAAAAAAAVAAAAPLIKAQSDVEARVCQLADGVQRLLQADREGGDRGRGLSQQTLRHLETLHSQQLQLQSQLLESALRIVTGHAPVTSTTSDLTASGRPAGLQVTHPDTTANVLSNQRQGSSATRAAAAAVETAPVAMATAGRDRWPEQTRGDLYHRGAPSVSTATQTLEGTHMQSSASHSQVAGRRANEVLMEMGRLKTEMKMLLTQPEDSLKTTRPPPDHPQSQQNPLQSQQNHLQSQQIQSQQNQAQPKLLQSQQSESKQIQSQPQRSQSHQNQSQPNQFQSQQSQSQQNQSQSQKFQSHQSLFQQIQPQQNQIQFQSQSVLVQRRPVVPSMLEEAGQVLRKVQRQKKVLEENLEALLRAKTGDVLHCQLEALAANRDWTEEVRIKKTVDAWISTLSKDVQAETSSENAALMPQLRAAGSSAHSARGKPVSALRGAGSRPTAGRVGRGQRARHRAVQGVEPGRVPGVLRDSDQVEGESYLTRLYGRAPYEGLRRTLKKSPYLRFSSPASPLSRKPRPRLVESVRGVKVKSCKTQTGLAPTLSPSPGRPHHHQMTSGDPTTNTYSVPMAIPLGRRRRDSSFRCVTGHQQEVTSSPTPPSNSSVVAVVDGAPEQQSQVEERLVEQLDAVEAPPPLPPPNTVIETKSEDEEDEENVFPGADFLSVADVVQEEVSVVGEEAVELDGGPSPPPVLYQGPVFPPQARSTLPGQDQASILDTNQQRDALENRLVEWVEQQLMSRMISEMYRPPPADPAQHVSTNESELEQRSVTSDIVEAAGGGGLQLFVDSNMSVDSALIRQLVNEVLTETVALMLGQRDVLATGPEPGLEAPKPGPAAHQEAKLVPLIPTPVPTPPPSPTTPVGEATPVTTPPPSEPTSLLNEESPQPIAAPEPVATPTPSQDPAPSAGSPPALHQAPPPLPWEDAELPLDEERPEEHPDTHRQPLVMSVAEDEPPLSSPLPPPPLSLPPAPSSSSPHPGSDPRPASPSSSSGDSSSSSPSSSSSSSITVTAGTDAALKHISEGELLISVNQRAATTEEDAVCSFSSSLQELQDMDYDSPSEGQVRGRDLLLTLLTKMEQGVTHRGERPQPEGSWGREERDHEEEVSVGEVTDDQTTKPLRTTHPRSDSKSTAARRGQTSSPGQISQCADVSEVSFEATNQGSFTMGDLMAEPLGTLTSDLQTDLSLSPPLPHLDNTPAARQVGPILVREFDRQTGCSVNSCIVKQLITE
ncbi:protein TALPID3 [Xiphias gladius]|uniref:protein TALPID3 n=1 Tax=Xiphias gladius TaxID=8245 RepID=UPI001A98270E|nr:protein TALPID3 [Xiphias gladius]